jgi:release factor glutamine methyltransferase
MSFGGLSIAFDDQVLRPRPWTSAQSYWAADLLRSSPAGPVLELCAGVGHIGLLAVTFQPRDLVLVDLDAGACDLARRNVAANPLASTVEVRRGRVDEVLAEHERFAGIIADPPWVPSRDVVRFPEDPLTAIDGGEDGMSVAWACLEVVGQHLADDGWALFQLGTTGQVRAVAERLAGAPELRLEVAEVREYGERGVLLHLARTP